MSTRNDGKGVDHVASAGEAGEPEVSMVDSTAVMLVCHCCVANQKNLEKN